MKRLQLQVINLLAMFAGTEELQKEVFSAPKFSAETLKKEYEKWHAQKTKPHSYRVCWIMSSYYWALIVKPYGWKVKSLETIGEELGVKCKFERDESLKQRPFAKALAPKPNPPGKSTAKRRFLVR